MICIVFIVKRNVVFIIQIVQFLIAVDQFYRKYDHQDKKDYEKHERCRKEEHQMSVNDLSDLTRDRKCRRCIFLLSGSDKILICTVICIVLIEMRLTGPYIQCVQHIVSRSRRIGPCRISLPLDCELHLLVCIRKVHAIRTVQRKNACRIRDRQLDKRCERAVLLIIKEEASRSGRFNQIAERDAGLIGDKLSALPVKCKGSLTESFRNIRACESLGEIVIRPVYINNDIRRLSGRFSSRFNLCRTVVRRIDRHCGRTLAQIERLSVSHRRRRTLNIHLGLAALQSPEGHRDAQLCTASRTVKCQSAGAVRFKSVAAHKLDQLRIIIHRNLYVSNCLPTVAAHYQIDTELLAHFCTRIRIHQYAVSRKSNRSEYRNRQAYGKGQSCQFLKYLHLITPSVLKYFLWQ